MPTPVIFVDRDGTLISEAPDFKIDHPSKVRFLPYAVSSLRRLHQAGYSLILVTNQDGLGTESLPADAFWPLQNLIVQVFESEGIHFRHVLIDEHFEHENHPNRKPGIGMVEPLLPELDLDRAQSFMIGDRKTDALFAQNLGIRSITLKEPSSPDGDADIRVPLNEAPTVFVTSLPEAADYILANR
jgi:imidazoleglycerol-phosphate dehydratase/histidinol-phosphatase